MIDEEGVGQRPGRCRDDCTQPRGVAGRLRRLSVRGPVLQRAGDRRGRRGVRGGAWFLAATLFGTRISAHVAERTFRLLSGAGINRITDAGRREWDSLVALLDAGGYDRYDFRTATRLQAISRVVDDHYAGRVGEIRRSAADPSALVALLDDLSG